MSRGAPTSERPSGTRHLVLVGMMGAGKSTIGRALAAQLGRPLLDSDDMVVERAGRSVREIWNDDGEDRFRQLEAEALRDALAAEEPSVIAAAGGIVLREENRELLKRADIDVVWLLADHDVLVERVRRGGHRPLLDDDPAAMLERMADERGPLYHEVADAVVSVGQRSIGDVTKAVLRCIA